MSLQTKGERAHKALFDQFGVSALEPGGFAKKDALRKSVKAEARQQDKMKRAANLAYRQAVRRGNRKEAMDILFGANAKGVVFGGISDAGSSEASAAQKISEGALMEEASRGPDAMEAEKDGGVGGSFDASQTVVDRGEGFEDFDGDVGVGDPEFGEETPDFLHRPKAPSLGTSLFGNAALRSPEKMIEEPLLSEEELNAELSYMRAKSRDRKARKRTNPMRFPQRRPWTLRQDAFLF